jgi:hypothetical protein
MAADDLPRIGQRIEIEQDEVEHIQADDPDDHATQPGPQVDVEG